MSSMKMNPEMERTGRSLRGLTRVIIATCALSLSACATIMTGPREEIHVTSSPAQARAELKCEKAEADGVTPVVLTIRRNSGDCILTLSKAGFRSKQVAIGQGVNPAYWTNMIFSPLVPAGAYVMALGDSGGSPTGGAMLAAGALFVATDFWTGAAHMHRPQAVDVVLEPE
jgi:hypothetical protein